MSITQNLYNLRVSNRGLSTTENATNQSWSVNLPEKLTTGNRPCTIKVVSGTIQILTDNTVFHTYSSVGIHSNISLNGFTTESSSENGYQTLQELFTVDLSAYHSNNILEPFRLVNQRTFHCIALPNQIEFGRFVTTTDTPIPFVGNWYVSFDLEIQFDNLD